MKGLCYLCGKVVAKSGMSRHIDACIRSKGLTGEREYFRLAVSGDYYINPPHYWLIVDARSDATLEDLDFFLRDVWLECCGHLSVFEIGGVEYFCEGYFVEPAEEGEERMREYRLYEVLDVGMEFTHEYDFGSTTELRLKVLNADMLKGGEKFMLLARNLPPELKCHVCGSKATMVCGVCEFNPCNGPFLFCKEHARRHRCRECGCRPSYCLPLTNSPRDGICGFRGGIKKFSVEKALERLKATGSPFKSLENNERR